MKILGFRFFIIIIQGSVQGFVFCPYDRKLAVFDLLINLNREEKQRKNL